MLEEQGNGLIKSGIFKFLHLLKDSFAPFVRDLHSKTAVRLPDKPEKSIQAMVKSGKDLKLSEVIKDDSHLEAICLECKKQGISFAIKQEDNGDRQLLYMKKDADLVEKNILNVLTKELEQKRSLPELIERNKEISGKEAQKIKNKEVSRDER